MPEPVLVQLAEAIHAVDAHGISVLGQSHRSDWFRAVVDEAEEHLRVLLNLEPWQRVVFLQGGGTAQFAMVPLLLGQSQRVAEYLLTGYWSGKSVAEARKFCNLRVLWDGAAHGYCQLPTADELQPDPEAAYLHYVSNETVEGLRFPYRPGVSGVPLVCDMSSDFCSRPIEASAFAIIYAHAQKNLGPAGVTVAIVDERLLDRAPADLPEALDYRPHIAARSIHNTPPVFAIYATMLILRWLRFEIGGLGAMAAINQRKAAALYQALDSWDGCYRPLVMGAARSPMNVSFALRDPEQTPAFLERARGAGLHGLEGHRSIGGLRASLYNAVSEAAVGDLIDFLDRQRKALR